MTLREIGRKCETARRGLGMTQVQLAELAGISYRPIYQIESGRSIGLDNLLKICDALGIDLSMKDRGGMSLGRS